MPPKLASCDPCRRSKLACNHERPVCSRCKSAGRNAGCRYRSEPFKRRRTLSPNEASERHRSQSSMTAPLNGSRISHLQTRTRRRQYPNPGYLGSSSHEAIFNHLREGNETGNNQNDPRLLERQQKDVDIADDIYITQGASLIDYMSHCVQIPTSKALINAWTSNGTNLALAGPFIEQYVENAESCLQLCGQQGPRIVSKTLYERSAWSLFVCSTSTIEEFADQFRGRNGRWETLGLFFAALSRAAASITVFKPLYETEQQRRGFLDLTLRLSDQCLDACLTLDCLNDLLLMLQYENFICHSYVHGDQSYHSWRKLGDVASSLLALGYHEQVEDKTTVPPFLRNLRIAAFARAYSADKNVSIFLGRPPRIHRKHCQLQVPLRFTDLSDRPSTENFGEVTHQVSTLSFDYMMDTEWSFNCAILKERILDLSKEEHSEEREEKLLALQGAACSQWQSLPSSFRLTGQLRVSSQHPVERDFMVSAKLNYLHVLLLLRLASSSRIPESDPELLNTSSSMLGLVADAMILKDHLGNSGTGLVWKVIYYGLPAAGIVSLYLLDRSSRGVILNIDNGKLLRDLSVLIAEVETGALVRVEEPNYALLAEATRNIKKVVDRVVSDRRREFNDEPVSNSHDCRTVDQEDGWLPWDHADLCDFELDFWLNLAEHPTLLNGEMDLRG